MQAAVKSPRRWWRKKYRKLQWAELLLKRLAAIAAFYPVQSNSSLSSTFETAVELIINSRLSASHSISTIQHNRHDKNTIKHINIQLWDNTVKQTSHCDAGYLKHNWQQVHLRQKLNTGSVGTCLLGWGAHSRVWGLQGQTLSSLCTLTLILG